VPYYGRLFAAAGLAPEQIRGVSDLRLIPVTTRAALQALPLAQRLPRTLAPERLRCYTTSGTTGRPLDVLQTDRDHALNELLGLRMYLYHGMRPWHRKVGLRSLSDPPADQGWNARLGLFRRAWISSRWPEARWVEMLQRFRPHYLFGFSLSLALMARALRARGPTALPLRAVFSTSGVLDAATRAEIRAGFGCPVHDVYAAWEGGLIAWECGRCPGYHINADWVIVEILQGQRPALPGEAGDVVITNLHSFGMPILRYRLGDVAVRAAAPSRCRCTLPLLGEIYGRQCDVLVLPGGRLLSPQPVYAAMDGVPGLRRWRVVQEAPDRLRVEAVAGRDCGPDSEARIRQALIEVVDEPLSVAVTLVADPPWAEDSKFRAIVSEVARGERPPPAERPT
jgi:phenylacetate-CoA ligase